MKLAEVSVKRPVFTTVMILSLLVFGLFSLPRIGVDQYPEVEFPVVTAVAIYPGADPQTVESKVVDPLEEAINSVSGIDELRSTSAETVGIVVTRFVLERDGDKALQDVRDKVSATLAELPSDVEPPIVQKLDIGAAPIMSIVLSAEISTRDLTKIADDTVKQRLQTLNGVGDITIVGGQEREFQINVNPMALQGFDLSVDDIGRAVTSQNIEIPGGRLTQGTKEFTIRTEGQLHSAEELADVVLGNPEGRVVRLSDVAEVRDAEEERRSYSTLNGKSAVALTIQKQSGANTVAVAADVREELEKIREDLDGVVKITVPIDGSVFIERSIDDVQFDLLFGALLAVIIIMIFLRDWRATLISALALPTSVIATFAFINVMGFTFNMMTMLALTLSIGILIDDAIVVIENIYRHMEMGKTAREAALDGTSEIGLAVLAITASIIAVFVPVATMKGIIGRFFFQFGMTVAFAVAVSLFVAFTLTPMLSARLLKPHHEDKNPLSRLIERVLTGVEQSYEHLIRAALRHPIVTGLVAIGSFVGALGIGGLIPFEFIPLEDRGEFKVFVELPTGTSLEETTRAVQQVTDELEEIPGITTTFATIGGGQQGEVNKSSVHVLMVDKDERAFGQADAMSFVRTKFSGRKDMTLAVEAIRGADNSGERQGEVQYLLLGDDYKELEKTADAIIAEMNAVGGYVDVDKSLRAGKPELQIEINRFAAADLNVPVASIAMAIRTLYAGDKVTELSTDGDRFDVRVRMAERLRDDPANILNVSVRNADGELVPLTQLVRVTHGDGPATIQRFNRQRQVTIFANLEGKVLGEATNEIAAIAAKQVPPGIVGRPAGNAEMLQDTVRYMIEALLLAVILIFLILAAQFESFIHPLTILMSLPLSLIGALGALALFGMTMNIFTMIGFIMLMGLVTKNAVLLVDYTNVLRHTTDMSRFDALVRAGRVRLRPILMTTAAMVGGMMPVAMALSAGGESRAPMAVAVIGGLIASTALTLVVVPVVYQTLDTVQGWITGGRDKPTEDGEVSEHPETA